MDNLPAYSLLHYINESIKLASTLKRDDVVQALQEIHQDIESPILGSSHEIDMGEESFKDLPHDIQLEQAFEVLKNESKPGPTLLSRTLDIEMSLARSLWKELTDSGRIVKNKGLVKKLDTDVSSDEKSTDEPKMMELINTLPKGDDMLVAPYLQPLVALDEVKRSQYLSGLKLEDLITSDDIARGTKRGVNTILIDQINKLSRSKRPKVKDEELIVCNRNGNEREQKYFKIRSRVVKAIPKGKELYSHMAANGLTKRVLSDLTSIAKAIAAAEV